MAKITFIIISLFMLNYFSSLAELSRTSIRNKNYPISNNMNEKMYNNINKKDEINNNYNSFKTNSTFFAVLRKYCDNCGLFSFYIYYLGCANKYINKGFIPIIDLKSHPNMYNNYSISNVNPWEYFFEQPYGFTLEEVTKNESLNVSYFYCKGEGDRPDERYIFYNKILIDYWHILATKFIPIKREIIIESENIKKHLFGNSSNVLGIKIRGTDYIAVKPRYHPIPPSLDQAIKDVKKFNHKNKYEYYFFVSEDEKIKEKFMKNFKPKIKCYNSKTKINYSYNERQFFTAKKDVIGNIDYAKNYLINIYILTQCIDIIMTRGSGGAGIMILANGFRNSLIYNLGEYS